MSATSTLPKHLRVRYGVLGAVAVSLVIASFALTWIFLKGGFQTGTPVRAVFSSRGVGQQLPIGGDVKVRGVLVGRIQDIRLSDQGGAIVDLLIHEEKRFPESSRVEIRSKTVFGQKWVELIPPADDSGPYLSAGSTIPDERTTEPLEFELALQLGHDLLSEIPLQNLSRILRALAEGFSGQEGDARTALDEGLVALRAVNARSDELDLSLRQLAEFSAWLNENDDEVIDLLASVDSANRALVGAAPEFVSSLDSVPEGLNDVSAFQERTESELGRLVENGATLAEIVAARSDQLTDIVVQLEAFNTVWNTGLSQPCGGVYERDMTCWQVYQMPGMDSRGTYGDSGGPLSDEAGDPGTIGSVSAPEMTEREFHRLLQEYGSPKISLNLARILFSEAGEEVIEGSR